MGFRTLGKEGYAGGISGDETNLEEMEEGVPTRVLGRISGSEPGLGGIGARIGGSEPHVPVTRGRRVGGGGGGSDAGPAAVQCREGGEAGCRMLRAALLLPLWLPLAGAGDTDEPTQESVPLGEPPPGLALFRWQWHEVEAPYLVALWILVASLAKIGECVCVCSRARAQAGGPQRTRLQTPGSSVLPCAGT